MVEHWISQQKKTGFLPKFADAAELEKDNKLFNDSIETKTPLETIAANMGNIATLAGSDLYVVCLSYYAEVKRGAKLGVPDARAIYDDLRQFFADRKNKSETPPQP